MTKKNSKDKSLAGVFLRRHSFDRTEMWHLLKELVLEKYWPSTAQTISFRKNNQDHCVMSVTEEDTVKLAYRKMLQSLEK